MSELLFSDNDGIYMLLDYHPSHSQLLIRRKMDKTIEHNVDLIFKSVDNISIPTRFKGIRISIIKEGDHEIPQHLDFSTNLGFKIFRLEDSSGVVGFLNAGVFGVFNNKLMLLESSLGDALETENNICVFWSEKSYDE